MPTVIENSPSSVNVVRNKIGMFLVQGQIASLPKTCVLKKRYHNKMRSHNLSFPKVFLRDL